MEEELIKKLRQLLTDPATEEIDHLRIIDEIYNDYPDETPFLNKLIQYYLNGMDDLPTLAQKSNWNKERFDEYRQAFLDSYPKLNKIVRELISKHEEYSSLDLQPNSINKHRK